MAIGAFSEAMADVCKNTGHGFRITRNEEKIKFSVICLLNFLRLLGFVILTHLLKAVVLPLTTNLSIRFHNPTQITDSINRASIYTYMYIVTLRSVIFLTRCLCSARSVYTRGCAGGQIYDVPSFSLICQRYDDFFSKFCCPHYGSEPRIVWRAYAYKYIQAMLYFSNSQLYVKWKYAQTGT